MNSASVHHQWEIMNWLEILNYSVKIMIWWLTVKLMIKYCIQIHLVYIGTDGELTQRNLTPVFHLQICVDGSWDAFQANLKGHSCKIMGPSTGQNSGSLITSVVYMWLKHGIGGMLWYKIHGSQASLNVCHAWDTEVNETLLPGQK